MKKTFFVLAAICAIALLPLSHANAGISPTYRLTGYTPCGKPIYSYFHVCGYDSSGSPVGQWVEQYPGSCRCRLQRPRCESRARNSAILLPSPLKACNEP